MDASRNFMGGIHFVLAWILLLFIVIDIVSNCLSEDFKRGIFLLKPVKHLIFSLPKNVSIMQLS